jgi:hypothetical protein
VNFVGRRVRDNRVSPSRTGRVLSEELGSGLRVAWDGEHGVEIVAFTPEVLRHVVVEVSIDEALRI